MSTVPSPIDTSKLIATNRPGILIAAGAIFAIALPIAATQIHTSGFLPHLYCYLANGPLVWTHVICDLLIGFSYVAISYTLWFLVRQSQGAIPFHWLLLAFGLFIVACGATHFMEVLTIWKPYYWVSAAVKVVTAAASISTAIALPVLCPTILRRLKDSQTAEERRVELEKANVELERLNRERRESDRLKDALVAQQAAKIGDWVWNMKTGENVWSEAVEVMHGIAPGAHDGRYESWWATVHPEDQTLVAQAVQRAIASSEYEVEYRTVRPGQSAYWTAARGKVMYGQDGQPERLIGICMDVTGRKANEAMLLRAEKLAAAGRLAATVAHEINNPLEAVTNLVYLARTAGNSVDTAQVLAMAERELARVSAIARQTLSFYRDTSSPSEFQVVEVLDQVIELYGGKLQAKQLRVQKTVNLDAWVRAPRGDLHQVFANLLSNAIDASPLQGSIELAVCGNSDGSVIVEVEDEGPGIPDEVARRLFEPFFTTKKDIGNGLGLWVSRRLVEQMGGNISFRSNGDAGQSGTCFRVRLAALDHRE